MLMEVLKALLDMSKRETVLYWSNVEETIEDIINQHHLRGTKESRCRMLVATELVRGMKIIAGPDLQRVRLDRVRIESMLDLINQFENKDRNQPPWRFRLEVEESMLSPVRSVRSVRGVRPNKDLRVSAKMRYDPDEEDPLINFEEES